MNIPVIAKALVAALVAALTPASASAVTTGTVSTSSIITGIIAAFVSFGATYATPWTGPAGKGVAGIVVTLKTDASKFLAVIMAGLPALVENAAQTALNPPSPVALEDAPTTVLAPPVYNSPTATVSTNPAPSPVA